MEESSGFVFELYLVCFPKKAPNSAQNDSCMLIQPRIITRSDKHDEVRRVVKFRNKVYFSDDADLIPGHPCDGSTQFFKITVFTRRCVITFAGRRMLDEEVAQVIFQLLDDWG